MEQFWSLDDLRERYPDALTPWADRVVFPWIYDNVAFIVTTTADEFRAYGIDSETQAPVLLVQGSTLKEVYRALPDIIRARLRDAHRAG